MFKTSLLYTYVQQAGTSLHLPCLWSSITLCLPKQTPHVSQPEPEVVMKVSDSMGEAYVQNRITGVVLCIFFSA